MNYTRRNFSVKSHGNQVAALHINNRTHNAELWLCDTMEKRRFLELIHIDFVLLLKYANRKTEHAYRCRYSFAFIPPSIHLIFAHTLELLLYRAHSFLCRIHTHGQICIIFTVSSFRPFTCLFGIRVLCCDKILRWIMSMKIRYRACVSHWCAEYCRLTDNRSKRRKGAIIYQMITS